MAGAGHNSGESIADDLLRSGYERWLRLEEEKAAIGEDLKELFAELKGNGFTPKALRESFRRVRNIDDADQQEHDAIVDLYVSSLTGARRAPARVHGNKEEFDAETGEIRNEPEAAAEVAGDYLREPAAAEQGQIVREGDAPRETGRFGGDASSPDTEYQDGETAPLSDGLAGPACAQDAEAANTKPAPISDADIPAFAKAGYPQPNPRCQKLKPDCKYSHHPSHIACATCESAHQIAQRKARAAA